MVRKRRRDKADSSWINIGYVESEDTVGEDDIHQLEEFAKLEEIPRPPSSQSQDELVGSKRERDPDKKDAVSILSTHTTLTTGPGGTAAKGLPFEWYANRISTYTGGFDLETWWRRSPKIVRFNALFVVLLLVLALANLIMGLTFILKYFLYPRPAPYICKTDDCHKAAVYMTYPMNFSVDPCDNFYEFMCGKYEEEFPHGEYFTEMVSTPGFKMEVGEESVLSKILRDFRNDHLYDQSIRYYQSCLNEPAKKTHGTSALIKRFAEIFGTDDFSTFESSTSPTLEQMAARIFETVGQGFIINFAFASYPYIQLLKPSQIMVWSSYEIWPENRIIVEHTFQYLKGRLGLPESSIKDLVNGVGYWSDLVHLFDDNTRNISYSDAMDETKFHGLLKDRIPATYCPPMGLKLDMAKVFSDFLKVRWSEEYYDTAARKYWVALRWCFDQPTANFDFAAHNLSPSYKKLDFVSLWLLGVLVDIMQVMHRDFIYEVIPKSVMNKIDDETKLKRTTLVRVTSTVESICTKEFWRALGYMSSLRYLSANFDDPVSVIANVKQEVIELFDITRKLFWNISRSEIHPFAKRLGQLILGRPLHVDMVMPLIGGILDEYIEESLVFTPDDHLENHFMALNLTIQSGRMYWLSSPNPIQVPKWWGFGGPQKIRDKLFDFRFPFVLPARFTEEVGAFAQGRWSKSVGRANPNYLLFSLALFTEPHIKETLALKIAGFSLKVIRAQLSLLEWTSKDDSYPYFTDRGKEYGDSEYLYWREQMRNGSDKANETKTCHVLNLDPQDDPQAFKYEMEEVNIQELSSNDDFYRGNIFYNTMAVKMAFKLLKMKRKELNSTSYKSLDPIWRKLRVRQRLPGPLAGYNEDQLFFMSYVRHQCRLSWKKDKSTDFDYTLARYALETDILNTLMHSKEFQKTWKCKKNSFMNNNGLSKCFKWKPLSSSTKD